MRPEVLICDEPVSALDVSVQAQILNLMRDLQARLGLTYLFISHNLAVVSNMASAIGVLYLGRLVEKGPAAELLTRPRHPYTRMLVDAVPDIAAIGVQRAAPKGETTDPARLPVGCPYHPRCPLAVDRCRAERPLMRPLGGVEVACHRAEEVQPPLAQAAGLAPAAPSRAGSVQVATLHP